jgi:hypothetical protein
VSGIRVSQTPMSVSHDALSRCVPLLFAVIQVKGAVCRCKEASRSIGASEDVSEMREMRAERSCEAVATRIFSSSSSVLGIEQTDVIGAECTDAVYLDSCE